MAKCFHGKTGCGWCGGLAGENYVRYCYKCFLYYDDMRSRGEAATKHAEEGKDYTVAEIKDLIEIQADFNRRWDNSRAFIHQDAALTYEGRTSQEIFNDGKKTGIEQGTKEAIKNWLSDEEIAFFVGTQGYVGKGEFDSPDKTDKSDKMDAGARFQQKMFEEYDRRKAVKPIPPTDKSVGILGVIL